MRDGIDKMSSWLNGISEDMGGEDAESLKTFNDRMNPYEDIKCDKCGNDTFKNSIKYGGGGSGTYLRFTCTNCDTEQELDFENPNYDG